MGQINMPVLNKAGISIFWDSCYENNFNFSREIKINLFCKKVIYLFFKDSFLRNFIFFNKKKILNLFKDKLLIEKNILFYINNMFRYKSIVKYFIKNKFIVYYPTKIFFIKYNYWVILTFRIYSPIKRKRRKKKKSRLNLYNFLWKQYLLCLYKRKYFSTSNLVF